MLLVKIGKKEISIFQSGFFKRVAEGSEKGK